MSLGDWRTPGTSTWVAVATNMSEEAAAKRPQPWAVPAIDGSDGKGYLTAGRLQELQKDAYDEAWKSGHAEGLAAGQKEIQRRAERYDELLRALSKPFDELDESVEKQLVELSIALLETTVSTRNQRSTRATSSALCAKRFRHCRLASRNIQVHLHPDDAALVRETLRSANGDPAWQIVEDPLCTRGGCRVTTDSSKIDASAESRLHAVISRCLGDERDR